MRAFCLRILRHIRYSPAHPIQFPFFWLVLSWPWDIFWWFLYKAVWIQKSVHVGINWIIVLKNSDGEIENITATLLIHGSSIDRGDYVERENYIAYFKTFKDLRLPYKIMFSPLTDKQFEKPRIEIELDYLFHRK